MDVDSFIALHQAEWRRLDAAVAKGAKSLAARPGPEIDDAVRLYLRASAHLAEARVHYGDTALHAYLNALVARSHAAIYSARPRTLRGFLGMFGSRYRRAIRETAPFIVAAAALFVAVALAVMLWVALSPDARAGLIPPAARSAIQHASGRRSGIGVPSSTLSVFILLNNFLVACFAFAFGITLGVGTLYLLLQNAALLGLLAGGFQAAGKSGAFWSLILPHGLLEITAICIAGGAGLRIAWAIIHPGELGRAEALGRESREAVVVVVGVFPAFAMAAAVEGFVTGVLPGQIAIGLGAALAAAYAIFLFGLPRRGGSKPALRLDP